MYRLVCPGPLLVDLLYIPYTHSFVALCVDVWRTWIHSLDSAGCRHLTASFLVVNHLSCHYIHKNFFNLVQQLLTFWFQLQKIIHAYKVISLFGIHSSKNESYQCYEYIFTCGHYGHWVSYVWRGYLWACNSILVKKHTLLCKNIQVFWCRTTTFEKQEGNDVIWF